MSRKKGRLFVISGPSGTGKGTVCAELLKEIGNEFSVSMTTREPREGEVHGKDYFFVTREHFLENIEAGNFLEHATVFDNLYGTPKDMVINRLEKGRNVILDIDVHPPSLAELRRRLEGRGTETAEKIEKRLGQALNEIRLIGEYDYYIVNDDLEDAVALAKCIMAAEAAKVPEAVKPIIREYENESKQK